MADRVFSWDNITADDRYKKADYEGRKAIRGSYYDHIAGDAHNEADREAWVSQEPKYLESEMKDRSAPGEILAGFKSGAMGRIPDMAGKAMQWGSKEGSFVNDVGKGMSMMAKENVLENPEYMLNPKKHGAVVNALAGGAEMLVPSMAAPLAIGAGLAALPETAIGAGTAAAISSAIGTIPAAMAQGQETYENVKKSGGTEKEAKTAGWKNLGIEWGGETIGNALGLKFIGVGKKALGMGASRLMGDGIASATDTAIAKPFLKNLSGTAVGETATEMGQGSSQAYVEREAGVKGADPLTAAKESIGPTLGMTALLAPFGLRANYKQSKQAEGINRVLSDPASASPEGRMMVVDMLHQDAVKNGIEDADAWRALAEQDVMNGMPVRRNSAQTEQELAEQAQAKFDEGEPSVTVGDGKDGSPTQPWESFDSFMASSQNAQQAAQPTGPIGNAVAAGGLQTAAQPITEAEKLQNAALLQQNTTGRPSTAEESAKVLAGMPENEFEMRLKKQEELEAAFGPTEPWLTDEDIRRLGAEKALASLPPEGEAISKGYKQTEEEWRRSGVDDRTTKEKAEDEADHSLNPDWIKQPAVDDFFTRVKQYPKDDKRRFSIGAKEVRATMKHVAAGQGLTPKQKIVYEFLVDAGSRLPELAAHVAYNRLPHKGYELEGRHAVNIESLADGDKIVIDGVTGPVEYTKGRDEEGSVVLEDHVNLYPEPFENIENVIASKISPERTDKDLRAKGFENELITNFAESLSDAQSADNRKSQRREVKWAEDELKRNERMAQARRDFEGYSPELPRKEYTSQEQRNTVIDLASKNRTFKEFYANVRDLSGEGFDHTQPSFIEGIGAKEATPDAVNAALKKIFKEERGKKIAAVAAKKKAIDVSSQVGQKAQGQTVAANSNGQEGLLPAERTKQSVAPWQMTLLEYGKSKLPPAQANKITKASQVRSLSGQHIKEIQAAIEREEDVPLHVLNEYKGNDWADKELDHFSTKQSSPTPLASKDAEAHPGQPSGVDRPDGAKLLDTTDQQSGEEDDGIIQGSVGAKLATGQVVKTLSGRETTPFPKVDMTSERKARMTISRVDKWLMQNALDEARSRGDKYNARMFESGIKRPQQADKDSAEMYLFGSQPDVVPSILKDMEFEKPTTQSATGASPGRMQEAEAYTQEKMKAGDAGDVIALAENNEQSANQAKPDSKETKEPLQMTRKELQQEFADRIIKNEKAANDSGFIPYVQIRRNLAGGRFVYEGYAMEDDKPFITGLSLSGNDSISAKLARRKGRYFNVESTVPQFATDEAFSLRAFVSKVRSYAGDVYDDIKKMEEKESSNANKEQPADIPQTASAGAEAHPVQPSDVDRHDGAEAKNDAKNGTKSLPQLGDDAQAKQEAFGVGIDFSGNKLFTASAVEKAMKRLKEKRNTLMSGLDPEMMQDVFIVGGAYFEHGARTFSTWAKAVIDGIGKEFARYLPGVYENLRLYPGLDTKGMTPSGEVAGELNAILIKEIEEAKNVNNTLGSTQETTDNKVEGQPSKEGTNELLHNNDTQEVHGRIPATHGGMATGTVQEPNAGHEESKGNEGGEESGKGNAGHDKQRNRSPRGRGRGAKKVHLSEAGEGSDRSDGEGSGGELADTPARIPATNFSITDDLELGKGSESVKYTDNIAAIKTLKQIEADGRRATPEEQRILARYVGWGGLANAFRNRLTKEVAKGWEDRVAEVEAILTDEELKVARNSTKAAHYTSQSVVRGIWEGVKRLGFTGGTVLEPSMGTGNFLGLAPHDTASPINFMGVEYDPITARIATLLYPQASVFNSGFEKIPLPDNSFDLVIGNPPFGQDSLSFPYSPHLNRYSIHNQFMLAGIDSLKPDGIQAFVVSRYFMDAKDSSVRQAIAEKANLIGAIRLPDTAFKENARTEVVTDIVFFQKKQPVENTKAISAETSPTIEQKAQPWTETALLPDPEGGEAMNVNRYFIDNPGHIIGTLDRTGSMRFRNDITVHVEKGADLQKLLSEKIKEVLPENIAKPSPAHKEAKKHYDNMVEAIKVTMAGGEDGDISISDDGRLTGVYEREIEEDSFVLGIREIKPGVAWSESLRQDKDGKWYREVDVVDEKGNKVKNGRENLKTREVFQSESDIPASMRLTENKFVRLKDAINVLDALKKQIALEMDGDSTEKEIEANRKGLRSLYNDFRKAHGFMNDISTVSVIDGMPNSPLLYALENKYKKAVSKLVAKRDGLAQREATAQIATILNKRVIYPYTPKDKADNANDALSITLSESGGVDMQRLAVLLDTDEQGVIEKLHTSMEKPLIYHDIETDRWVTADEYLSGNVARKLEAAKDAGKSKNVSALKAAQPEKWESANITPTLGANWIPAEVYSEFAQHIGGDDVTIHYGELTNTYDVYGYSQRGGRWGTSEKSPTELLTAILNRTTIRVGYTDEDGVYHVDQDATAFAIAKAEEIKEEFSEWVFRDDDRRESLTDSFNKKYNNIVLRQRDGSHLTFPGKVPDAVIELRRHQKNGVWRGITDRFVLYDHAVGAGKTFTGIARAMERRRMGLSRKPMVVVPNHLVPQWAADVYRLYPGAKVLAATKKDLQRSKRRRLFAKIATGDWDIVIVPESSFGFIGISTETEMRYLAEEIKQAELALKEAQEEHAAEGSRFKPPSVKAAEAMLDKLKGRMEKLRDSGRKKDRLLTFEQMGIDDLTIDEAHSFKNLFYHSVQNVRGMNPKEGSGKAYDLWNKIRVLRESPRGSIAFLTGTPISNSAVEMYILQRYLGLERLKEMGLEHFDAWQAQYATVTTAYEPTDSGRGLKAVTRLGRDWVNMRSLIDAYYQFADSVTNDDIKEWFELDNPGQKFPIPELDGGARKVVSVKPTPAQEAILEEVVAGFNGLPGIRNPNERAAERLKLMNRAREVSLDAREVDSNTDSTEEGGKLQSVAEEVTRIYRKWDKENGTQLVFLDRSTPKASKRDVEVLRRYDSLVAQNEAAYVNGDADKLRTTQDKLDTYNSQEMEAIRRSVYAKWNAYQQIKDNLIASGIPADEIRFIHEANTDTQKAQLFEQVNSGQVRVLIGSTPRMGAGTNVQERLVALHHVDVTWKPSDIEQREGRIIRQGNNLYEKYGHDNFKVEVVAYVTETTVDQKLWALNATKLKMINGIRKYNGEFSMEFDDADMLGLAEVAAIASGDPLRLELVSLSSQIDKLNRLKKIHRNNNYSNADRLKKAEKVISNNPKEIEKLDAVIGTIEAGEAAANDKVEARSVEVGGEKFNHTGSFKAMQKIMALKPEKDEDGKITGKFRATIDGKEFTNFEKAKEYIESTLGDHPNSFSASIGKKEYTQRVDVNRDIAAKLTSDRREDVEIKLGTLSRNGVDTEITAERNADGTVDLFGESYIAGKNGKREKIGLFQHTITAAKDGKVLGVSVSKLFSDIEKGTSSSRFRVKKEEYEQELKNANKNIASLREAQDAPFLKEEELQEKTARMIEVEGILAERGEEEVKFSRQSSTTTGPNHTVQSFTDKAIGALDSVKKGLGGALTKAVDIISNNDIPAAVRAGAGLKSVADRVVSPGTYPDSLATVHASTNVSKVTGHKDFDAAKSQGDIIAADRVVRDTVKTEVFDDIARNITEGADVVVVPVQQRESSNMNMLPLAYADALVDALRERGITASVYEGIVKESGDHNTGVRAENRTRNQQVFNGDAPPAGSHIIVVDDTFTSGATMSALIDHIQSQGVKVSQATTIAKGRYQNWLRPTPEKIKAMLDKAGIDELQFKHETGYPPEHLTGSEVQGYLLNGARGLYGLLRRFPPRRSESGIQEAARAQGDTQEVVPKFSQDGKIMGFVHNGRINIVADNIPQSWTDEQIVGLFEHEIAVHALQLGKSDKEFQAILAAVERMYKAGNKAVVEARNAVPEGTPAKHIWEETLAYLAQHKPGHSLARRFLAWFRSAIRKITANVKGMGKLRIAKWANDLNEGDLIRMAREALKTAPERMAGGQVRREDALFSQIQAAKAIFSKLEEVARIRFAGLKAQSVENFMLKQGVKKAELEAVGLKEWLANKKATDKVSRDELQDFVRASMVETEDVVLGEPEDPNIMRNIVYVNYLGHFDLSSLTDEERKRFHEIDFLASDGNLEGDEITDWETLSAKTKIDSNSPLAQAQAHGGVIAPTNFSEYSEPGAEKNSYREMFVTAPDILNEWRDGHSQYSDISNPIVRIRFNARTDAQGRKMLFVEEMQGPSKVNQDKMPAYLKENIYQLGVKRVLAYAKENGFDGVAWMTGMMQDERYSLSKQVSEIRWMKIISEGESKDGKARYAIAFTTLDGQRGGNSAVYTAEDLPDVIGKELASKVVESDEEAGKFVGESLMLSGGKGLKRLYDNDLPAMFKSYGKEGVGIINLDGVGDVQFVPITDKTPGSYPLFSAEKGVHSLSFSDLYNPPIPQKYIDAANKITETSAFKKWFGKSKITSYGRPHILYHGTSHGQFLTDPDYNWTFDQSRTPSRISSPFAALGTFLGNDTIAYSFTDGDTRKMHPFFVRIENPLVITSEELERKAYDYDSAKAFRRRQEELNGHDGIIIKDRGQVIVFHPNQLKSAIENNGEFSLENNDVRYSIAPEHPASTEGIQDTAKKFFNKYSAKYANLNKIDTSVWSRIFQSPEYYFKKVAALERVMKAALGRRGLRFKYEHHILGKEFIKFSEGLKETDKESYDEANDYLVDTDQTGHAFRMKMVGDSWQVYNPEKEVVGIFKEEDEAKNAMMQAEHDRLLKDGFSANAARAVYLARQILNTEFDMRVADMRRIQAEYKANGLPDPFISDDAIDGAGRYGVYADGNDQPVALFATKKEADAYIDIVSQDILYRVVDETSNSQKKTSLLFASNQRAEKWAAKRGGIVSTQKRFGKLMVKERTDDEMRPLTLSQSITQMGDLRGSYFPRIRQSGEYVLIATKDGANPRREHFDLPVAGEKWGAKGAVANWTMANIGRVFPNAASRMQELKAQGYKVEFKKDDSPVEDVFDAAKLIASIDAIIADNLSTIDKNDSDEVKAALHVDALLTMQIADIFKSRGALSSRMKRVGTVWEGYETDMRKAIVQSARDTAAGLAKRDTAKAMLNAFTGRDFSWQAYKSQKEEEGKQPSFAEYMEIIDDRRVHPGKQKNAYRDGRAFMIDVLRNSEHADRIMGTLQGLAVLKFLGFRVSSAAVNITNMVTGVPGTISGLTGESISKVMGRITNAASAYSKYRKETRSWKPGETDLDEADRRIFQFIVDNGWDEAQFNHEAAGVLMSKGGEMWNKFSTAAMFMFGAVEKVNRATTIFAAYKAIMAQNPNKSFVKAMEEAHDVSNRAHGVYGKETLPAWARGKMNPLRLTYTFQKFTHNYMMNMIDMGWNEGKLKESWKEGKVKAAAYLLLSPAVLAGAGASIAGPAIFALAGALGIGGDDPEEEFYKWAADNLGSDTVARHGLAGLVGLNLKGSLGANMPMPADIAKMTLYDLAGAPGGAAKDVAKSFGHFHRGEVAKGAEYLLPTAFGSMSKAIRESQEGVSTGSYGQVFYGDEPLKADTLDAILRFFSFNPSRLSWIREKQRNEKEVAAKYQERKNEIYSELKRLNLQGKPIFTPETLKKIKRYNELVRGSGRTDIRPITTQRIRLMMRRNAKASRHERMRAAMRKEREQDVLINE